MMWRFRTESRITGQTGEHYFDTPSEAEDAHATMSALVSTFTGGPLYTVGRIERVGS